MGRSSKLIHKFLVKLGDTPHPLSARRQESSSDMECVFFLTKASTGNNTNPGRVKKAEGIELIRGATLFLRSFDGFGWNVDGWEKVHGALRKLAGFS